MTRTWLRRHDSDALVDGPPPRLHVYSGVDRAQVLAALEAGRESGDGPARLVLSITDSDQLAERAAHAHRWLLGEAVRPFGAAFRERPLVGEVAFVYAGGSMAYPGMGRELMLAFPDQLDGVEQRCGPLRPIVGWAFGATELRPGNPVDQIGGASVLGQLHTRITRELLNLHPQAALGYSSGEAAALAALGAWPDVTPLLTEARDSDLFTRQVAGAMEVPRRAWRRMGIEAGGWASHLAETSVDRVRAAVADEPAVHLMVVNAPGSCVFGGEATGCERVLRRLADVPTLPIQYEIAAHVPEVEEVRATWRRLHHLPTKAVPGVRFYTCATGEWYIPTADAAADAVTAQGLGCIDFARTVERAWQDGVRIFVEHGPRSLCSGWISRTLGAREHLAVALDAPEGRRIHQLYQVVAELSAAGVSVYADALSAHHAAEPPTGRERSLDSGTSLDAGTSPRSGRRLPTPPARPPRIQPSHPAGRWQVMAAAPELPPPPEPSPRQPVPEPGPARMSPPPELSPWEPLSEPGLAHMSPPAAPSAAPPVPEPPQVYASHVPTSAVAEHMARISLAHRRFLASQAEAHRRYLNFCLSAAELAAAHMAGDAPSHRQPMSHPTTRDPAPPHGIASTHGPAPRPGVAPTFDSARRLARLPGPPFLFMSRAVAIDAPLGELRTGSWAEVEYDVPEEVWYFEQNDFPGAMPFSVVMEVVLQACGWLAAYVGSALTSEQTLLFRNLDGTGTVWREIGPDIGTLRTKTRLRELSRTSDMIIETFDIECSAGDEPIFSLSTVFGFFPPRAFDHQIGLPPSEEERSWLTQPSDVAFELGERPKQYFGESLRLPGPMLLMIDRVTGYWPGAGRAGLGRLRAEKNVDPGEWFFQAHFFQDPVQPGSLGVQAMCQLLQFYAIERGLGGALEAPRFRPILLGQPVTWKYRGQITPRNQKITIELEIVDVAEDEHETKITADGWLWADDTRIYHVRGLGIGIVPGSR